jgi:HEAT repeat protein
MGLLDRFKESKAARCIEAALQQQRPPEEAVSAARHLRDVGAEHCIPVLCEALSRGCAPLQVEAAQALAAIHKRHPDKRILEALNAAVLQERQPPQVRQAAIEGLIELVSFRHAGCLIEILKTARTPLPVRAAAIRGLKKLAYPEVLERLVESYVLGRQLDPKGEIRRWAVQELIALEDRDKLGKMHEIAHGRRKLRYGALLPEAGGLAPLVFLMAEVDPKASLRYLSQMTDDPNPAIRAAAAQTLQELRPEGKGPPAP